MPYWILALNDISSMFEGSYKLSFIDISQFDTSNMTNANNLFKDVFSLSYLNLGEQLTSVGNV